MLISGEEYKEYLELKSSSDSKMKAVKDDYYKIEKDLKSEIYNLKGTIRILRNQIYPLQIAIKEFKENGIYMRIHRETRSNYPLSNTTYSQKFNFIVSSKYLSTNLKSKLSTLMNKISGYQMTELKNNKHDLEVKIDSILRKLNNSKSIWINRKKLIKFINTK